MPLSVDIVTLGVPQPEAARAFYSAAFSATATDDNRPVLNLHGTGQLALDQMDALAESVDTKPTTAGFRGYVLSCIVTQPAEVRALLDSAVASGATLVKPAGKKLFGEFTATYQAPDGAVWKLAASGKKDTNPVPAPPKPTESAVYLGVAKPTASKVFYESLGMTVNHDYGDKFIDFTITGGGCRLGLLTRNALAKDAGVDAHGDGFAALVLTHTAASRDDVDALLAAADAAGGRVTVAATQTDQGHYAGFFTDPDGYHWKITTAA